MGFSDGRIINRDNIRVGGPVKNMTEERWNKIFGKKSSHDLINPKDQNNGTKSSMESISKRDDEQRTMGNVSEQLDSGTAISHNRIKIDMQSGNIIT